MSLVTSKIHHLDLKTIKKFFNDYQNQLSKGVTLFCLKCFTTKNNNFKTATIKVDFLTFDVLMVYFVFYCLQQVYRAIKTNCLSLFNAKCRHKSRYFHHLKHFYAYYNFDYGVKSIQFIAHLDCLLVTITFIQTIFSFIDPLFLLSNSLLVRTFKVNFAITKIITIEYIATYQMVVN